LIKGPIATHTFAVHASDRAGNGDPTPASRNRTVETNAPGTTITSGPSGTVAGAEATFTIASSEAQGTFECRLDGGAYAACASPHTVAAGGRAGRPGRVEGPEPRQRAAPQAVRGDGTRQRTLDTSVAAIQLGNETRKQPSHIIADTVRVTLQ
jgi:hypothetical protein